MAEAAEEVDDSRPDDRGGPPLPAAPRTDPYVKLDRTPRLAVHLDIRKRMASSANRFRDQGRFDISEQRDGAKTHRSCRHELQMVLA